LSRHQPVARLWLFGPEYQRPLTLQCRHRRDRQAPRRPAL